MPTVAVVRDPLFHKHSNGRWHPESAERLVVIDRLLARFPGRERLEELAARDATFEELARVHAEEYIRRIEATRGRSLTVLDPDTSATAESYDAAVRAAGGAIVAADAVLDGAADGCFAFLRPPGHHAERDRAMGFCIFNNIAVAAAHALAERDLQRVLIVDWDVHHGNGTMHCFYDTSRVLYMSVHQYPHYPGTGRLEEVGRGQGEGFTVNVPLSGGQGDADYLAVFRRLFLPIAREYAPQLLLVSAGFDSHRHDPLAGMALSSGAYGWMTRLFQELEGGPGRSALLLEGGYDPTALEQGVAAALDALLGERVAEPPAGETPLASTVAVIDAARRRFGRYWKSL